MPVDVQFRFKERIIVNEVIGLMVVDPLAFRIITCGIFADSPTAQFNCELTILKHITGGAHDR